MLETLTLMPELNSVSIPPELVWATLNLTFLAFSSSVRKRILRRDGYRCTVCGSTEHLEVAHYDHNKRSSNYNKVTNGRALCPIHHLQDHIHRAGTNGLNYYENEWAIHSLENRAFHQD